MIVEVHFKQSILLAVDSWLECCILIWMGYIHSITIMKTSYMQKPSFVSLYIQIELWHNIKESCHAKNCCLFGKFQCIYTSNYSLDCRKMGYDLEKLRNQKVLILRVSNNEVVSLHLNSVWSLKYPPV
jgi:hypothetical protein